MKNEEVMELLGTAVVDLSVSSVICQLIDRIVPARYGFFKKAGFEIGKLAISWFAGNKISKWVARKVKKIVTEVKEKGLVVLVTPA